MISQEEGSHGEARKRDNLTMNENTMSLCPLRDCRSQLMGVATVAIAVLHYYQLLGIPFEGAAGSAVMYFTEMGNTGVDIFLFLSGIGMYYSLSKNGNAREFYKRRLIRILPEYILILGLCAVIMPHFMQGYSVTDCLLLLCGAKFWIRGDLTDWYISLIYALYLLYPLLHMIIKKSVKAALCSAGIMAALLVTVSLVFYDGGLPRGIALARIPVFILGAVTGRLIKDDVKVSKRAVLILGLVSFLGADIIAVFAPGGRPDRYFTGFFYIIGVLDHIGLQFNTENSN